MIVTLMFAQAGYLAILYFGDLHPRRRGLHPRRAPPAPSARLDLSARRPALRASPSRSSPLGLLASLALVRSPTGRVLVAIRENAERTRMLGYDTFRYRLLAARPLRPLRRRRRRRLRACSSAMSARPSPRSSIRSCRCSGCCSAAPAPTLGPARRHALMFYLVDLAAGVTDAYLLVVGVALILLVLFSPQRHPRHARAKARCRGCRDACSTTRGLSRHFGGLQGRRGRRLRPRRRRDPRAHRPERRRQDHLRQPDLRPPRCPTPARSASTAATSPACPPTPACGSASPTPSRSPRSTRSLTRLRQRRARRRSAATPRDLARRRRRRRPRPRRPRATGADAPAGTLAYGHQRLLEIAMGLALAAAGC